MISDDVCNGVVVVKIVEKRAVWVSIRERKKEKEKEKEKKREKKRENERENENERKKTVAGV